MTRDLHSNCDALLQSLSEYIDGGLSDEMCQEIQKHLESCGDCRVVFNTTRRTIDLVRMPPREPESLPDDVRERLFKRLDLEGLLPARRP
jgi:predicted anti-sigma-YlaC factor YlaD